MDLKVFSEGDFPNYLPKLNALYDELFGGGKYFRAKLVGRVCDNIGVDKKVTHLLSQTIEFIHNASLLHDDLIDRSTLRRGKPTAWTRFTPEYAVLAGDYLLARVMVNLSAHGNIELVKFTSQTISDLLEGEWIQDSLVGEINLDLEQLTRVHNLKTSSLFKWCLKAPFLALENYNEKLHAHLLEMGNILGILFQRSDDLLDFDVRNSEGKAVLGDLRSGYVNSFAAFLFQTLDSQTRDRLYRSKSLGEFKKIIGEDYFSQHVDKFDALNSDLVSLYGHHILQMQNSSLITNENLIADLKKLPDYLYWRKTGKN